VSDFATDIILAAGGKPTPSSISALRAWQLMEGGHTKNKASFNWLNRTDQGYPTINSVGVAAYPDYQTGISRTVDLIKSGYPSVYGALQGGQFSFQDPGVQGDLNRWLTGKRTPGMSSYVAKIAKAAGQNPGPVKMPDGTPRPMSTSTFAGTANPENDISKLMLGSAMKRDPREQTLALMGALLQATRGNQTLGSVPAASAPAGPAAAGPSTYPTGTGNSAGIREAFYDPLGAYDEGNWIKPIGGHSDHVHLSFGQPNVALQAIKLAQQLGLRASENPYAEGSPAEPGVHTSTSYHYKNFPGMYDGRQLGMGLDVSGPAAKMAEYYNAVRSRWIR
jgi:hypothetical protein